MQQGSPADDQLNNKEKLEIIESLFQDLVKKLEKLHQEKIDLIKKIKEEKDEEELIKIRKSFND